MKFGIAMKIISLALSLLMLSNDAALALSPAVMSSGLGEEFRKNERDEIRATAQRRFAAKIGPCSFGGSLISGSEFTGDAFKKKPDGKSFLDTYGFEFADKAHSQVDDDVLYGGPELNRKIFKDGIIAALKYFRDHEARISEGDLDIVEGYFKVDEDSGELPIASLEKSKDRYTLIVHTKFVQMFEHIANNDVRFWYKFPDGQKRLVSAAAAIFYRLAKHEMSDISKKTNIPKNPGHLTQLAGISGLSVIKDETITGAISGRYNIINDSIWLWFLSSYTFLDSTRYNNDVFYDRAKWILTGEKARELDLHSEFPNLLANPEFKDHALHLAYAVNHQFFSKLSGAMPDLIVEDGFIRQWRDRETAGAEEIARATKTSNGETEGGGEERSNSMPISNMGSAARIIAGIRDKLEALGLTKRGFDVLQRLMEGKTYKDIAGELYVGEGTVNFHALSLYKKMGISGRMELFDKIGSMLPKDLSQGLADGHKEAREIFLTSREWDVMTLIMDGMSSTDAASTLHCRKKTVDFHLAKIYKKCGLPKYSGRAVIADLLLTGKLVFVNKTSRAGAVADRISSGREEAGAPYHSSENGVILPKDFVDAQIGKLVSNRDAFIWTEKIPYSLDNVQKAESSIEDIRQVLMELLALVYADKDLCAYADKIMRAMEIVFDEQGLQLRADAKLYPIHPLRAALNFIKNFGITEPDFIVSALLHDIVEDSEQYGSNSDLIGEKFGKIVQKNVQSVTNKELTASQKSYLREFLIKMLQLDRSSPQAEESLDAVLKIIEYQVGVVGEVSANQAALLLKNVDFSDNALTQKNLSSNPKLQSRLSSKYRDLLVIFAEEFEALAKSERMKAAGRNNTFIDGLRHNAQTYRAAYGELNEYSSRWEHAALQKKAISIINDNFGGLRGLAKELEKISVMPAVKNAKSQIADAKEDKRLSSSGDISENAEKMMKIIALSPDVSTAIMINDGYFTSIDLDKGYKNLANERSDVLIEISSDERRISQQGIYIFLHGFLGDLCRAGYLREESDGNEKRYHLTDKGRDKISDIKSRESLPKGDRFSSSGANEEKLPDYTDALINALKEADGVQREAARILGVSESVISKKIKEIRNAAEALKDEKTLYRLNRALVKNVEETLKALEEAHGSIAGAAKELGITYSAVEYRIKYIRNAANRLKDKELLKKLNRALVGIPAYLYNTLEELENTDGDKSKAAETLGVRSDAGMNTRIKRLTETVTASGDKDLIARLKKVMDKINRPKILEDTDKILIALSRAGGNKKEASKGFGISKQAFGSKVFRIEEVAKKLGNKKLLKKLNRALVKIPADAYDMLRVLENADGDKSKIAKALGISVSYMNRRIRLLTKAAAESGDRDLIIRLKNVMDKIDRPTMPGDTNEILMALNETGGNQTKAGRELGVSQRVINYKVSRIRSVAEEIGDEDTLNRLAKIIEKKPGARSRLSSSGREFKSQVNQPVSEGIGKPVYQRPSEMQPAELDHKLIKVLSRYIVKLGIDEGPGTISADEITAIWKTVNLLHEDQIQIFVPYRMNPTERMKKALSDINKKSGHDAVICRGYANGGHLKRFLKQRPAAGTKRIIITDEFSEGDIIGLLNESPELFKGIRLLNLDLPDKYARKTAYQAKIIMMALLARLFEKDKTPMVESLLRTMLEGALGSDERNIDDFVNNLDESGESETDVVQIRNRILSYLGKTISLVEKIGREIILMKEFWIAA